MIVVRDNCMNTLRDRLVARAAIIQVSNKKKTLDLLYKNFQTRCSSICLSPHFKSKHVYIVNFKHQDVQSQEYIFI